MFNYILVVLIFFLSIESAMAEEFNINTYAGKIAKTNDYKINWDWWEKFNDPTLSEILKQSVNNNFDLQIADSKVQEAQNYVDSSKMGYFPDLSLGGGYKYTKYSDLTPYGRNEVYNPNNATNNLLVLPLQASYELDLWGKGKTQREYFLENKDFCEFEKRFITLTTISEVTSLYFNILKNEKLIALYREITDIKKEKLRLNREKYELEMATKPEVINAEKDLKVSEQNITELKALNEELKNQLNLLVFGDKEKTNINFKAIDNIKLFYDSNLEVSTDKIAYRPDILMAEKQIKMAKLDAEAVKKSFLPSFAITGDLFQISEFFENFFSARSLRYRIGPGISYDLFNKKANKAELRAKKNIYEQMLKNYEKIIVSSINDVNNSIFYIKSSLKNYKRTQEISGLDKEIMDIEKQKLDMNLITYFDYLEAREKYINSRIREYESRTQCLIHTISLYKALGGNV